MEKEDAIEVMSHLAGKLEDVLAIEDVVSAFAEFLAHIRSSISEEDFAFLATIGAMIYLKGSRVYDSSVATDLLMKRLRKWFSGDRVAVRSADHHDHFIVQTAGRHGAAGCISCVNFSVNFNAGQDRRSCRQVSDPG
jgi:hypothetical protein